MSSGAKLKFLGTVETHWSMAHAAFLLRQIQGSG